MTPEEQALPVVEFTDDGQSGPGNPAGRAQQAPLDSNAEASETGPVAFADTLDDSDQQPELPYLSDQASSDAIESWQRIQAEFVDDPRHAVVEADRLVGELMQRIVSAFSDQRSDLEKQWALGHEVDTEQLRVCLQNYRAFFARLLPAIPPG
jgi:hypothetical protein